MMAAVTTEPSAAAASQPMAPLPAIPGRLPPQAPLAPVGAKQVPTTQDLRIAHANAKAVEVRQKAQQDQQKKLLAGASENQTQQLKERAEHLRKQRDLIVAKRKKQREEDLKNYDSEAARDKVSPPVDSAVGSSSMRSDAGHASDKASEEARKKQQLSQALALNMKTSLRGDPSFFTTSEQADRKADLEATKAQLRAEAEACRR